MILGAVGVADDCTRDDGGDADAHRLHEARNGEHGDALRQHRRHAGDCEQQEPGQQHRPPAEAVAQHTLHGLEQTQAEQIGRHEELSRARVGAQGLAQQRQRRHDAGHAKRRQATDGTEQRDQRPARP
jgi:hypothetical protein